MTTYEPVIGLEVHAELQTRSKMFCRCEVVDTTVAAPNTHVCPICLGLPGTLPVVNRRAVEFGMMAGLALNCKIAELNRFARKNYFYPDLPKGYQISQYEQPLAYDGWLEIDLPEGSKRIGIRRAHLEEDTGKLTHLGIYSLIDFNRAGVPLLEIVSEPDMRSAAEAEAYARKLRAILMYLGINSGDMSKGVLRFEVNISVRPKGSDEMRQWTEIKNLNSIRSLARAIAYEIERQTGIYEEGGTVKRQTLGWDEARGVTVPQRSKEEAHDYRYFPEPDLPPLVISREWVEEVRRKLPELPDAKRDRFVSEFGLSRYDAGVLVADRAVADYFESAIGAGGNPKAMANWIIVELFRLMNKAGIERDKIDTVKVTPQALVKLQRLVDSGTINLNTAKKVFEAVFEGGGDPEAIVRARGLAQMSDESELARIVKEVLDAHQEQVEQYLSGKEAVSKWLMGQVMRRTRGRANPQIVLKLLREQLEALKKKVQEPGSSRQP